MQVKSSETKVDKTIKTTCFATGHREKSAGTQSAISSGIATRNLLPPYAKTPPDAWE